MTDCSFSNVDFARVYVDTYCTDPEFAQLIYDSVFGDDSFESLSLEDQAFINTSFVGVDEDVSDVTTPNVDLVRLLNGLKYDDMQITAIDYDGTQIKVASVETLIRMKEETMKSFSVYRMELRPQDVIDHKILDGLDER